MAINKKGTVLIAGMILVLAVLSGCNAKNEEIAEQGTKEEEAKKIVAVSVVPEASFVKAVCGDLAEVVTMIPPGNSPENYEPTPQEIQKFSDALIYFSIGVPTEKENIMPNVGDNTKVVPLQKAVASVYTDRMIGESRDPHIWLSPKRAIVMVETIADEMSNLEPEHKEAYQTNAKEYIAKLEAVDQEIKDALRGVKNRKFVVYHPAFGYLADDYDLEMYALEEEGKEATADRLIEMIDFAREERIKVIFYQAEISEEQAKSFAEEIDGKTIMLAPLAEDYIDNLSRMAKTMAESMQ